MNKCEFLTGQVEVACGLGQLGQNKLVTFQVEIKQQIVIKQILILKSYKFSRILNFDLINLRNVNDNFYKKFVQIGPSDHLSSIHVQSICSGLDIPFIDTQVGKFQLYKGLFLAWFVGYSLKGTVFSAWLVLNTNYGYSLKGTVC